MASRKRFDGCRTGCMGPSNRRLIAASQTIEAGKRVVAPLLEQLDPVTRMGGARPVLSRIRIGLPPSDPNESVRRRHAAQVAPQFRQLGAPPCYPRTETGDANEYVRTWVYRNAGNRKARRSDLWLDPQWLAYTFAGAEPGALESQRTS